MNQVPAEIWEMILADESNLERKALRLSSRFFSEIIALRLDRVFLSPNPLNIEVLLAIADHETFRHGVMEVIYDDAPLSNIYIPNEPESSTNNPLHIEQDETWFARSRNWNRRDIVKRHYHRTSPSDLDFINSHVETLMSVDDAMDYYRELVKQQKRVIEAEEDTQALIYGLKRFPALKKVTITPLAHGILFYPLYQTPMIRAFPDGFNYPLPYGWLSELKDIYDTQYRPSAAVSAWARSDGSKDQDESTRLHWRGYTMLTRVLAEQSGVHNVTELNLNDHHVSSGLNARIFEHPNEDLNHFTTIISKPGFTHLNLTLYMGEHYECYRLGGVFGRGLLGEALKNAQDLKSIEIGGPDGPIGSGPPIQGPFFPFHAVFPVDHWPKLEHFGLFGVVVEKQELLDVLDSLPATVRTVKLGRLFINGCTKGWFDLLDEMREKLGWWRRKIVPRLTIVTVDENGALISGHSHWFEEEVNIYLKGGLSNPFFWDQDRSSTNEGDVKDLYRPAYNGTGNKPLDGYTLQKLGQGVRQLDRQWLEDDPLAAVRFNDGDPESLRRRLVRRIFRIFPVN